MYFFEQQWKRLDNPHSNQQLGQSTPIFGYELPTIGDGNCAFRSIIQSLLLECLVDNHKKILLINKLNALFNKHGSFVRDSRPELRKEELNINDSEFANFIREYNDASSSEINFDNFFKNYFPHEFLDGPNIFNNPAKDKIIQFMAMCLRREIISNTGLENRVRYDSLEYSYFDIENPEVKVVLQKYGLDLHIHQFRNNFEVDRAYEPRNINELAHDKLPANIHLSPGTLIGPGYSSNAHFSVAVFIDSYNKIKKHFVIDKHHKKEATNNKPRLADGIFKRIWKGFKKIFYKVANKLFDIFDELYDFFARRPYDVKDENTRVALKDPVKHESDADVFCEELKVKDTYKVNAQFEEKAGETPRFNIHVLSFDNLNEQENEENIEFLYRYIYGDSRVNGDKALDMSEENVRDIYRKMQRGQKEQHINKVFIAIDKNTGDKIGLISFGIKTVEVGGDTTERHRLVEPDIIIPRYYHGKLIEIELAIWAHRYLENFVSPVYTGLHHFAYSGHVSKNPNNPLLYRYDEGNRDARFSFAKKRLEDGENYSPIYSRLDFDIV